MKGMITSLIILIITCSLIAINAVCVVDCIDDMIEILESMPKDPKTNSAGDVSGKTRLLSELWNEKYAFLSMSINTAELRECGISIENLTAFCDSDTVSDYRAALSETKKRLYVLREREKLTFATVF